MNKVKAAAALPDAGRPKFHEMVSGRKKGWRRSLWLLWALMGPGLISAMADNDAGGVISYTVTGAVFGVGLFVPLVLCLAPLTFTIQEMSMRLGAVTRVGFSRLVLQHYGRFWGYYLISTLAFENLLILITEFIGMTAGLVLLGLPLWLGSALCLLLVVVFVLFTGYWTKERVVLFVAALNVVFLVVAVMTHPDPAAIGHAFAAWDIPASLHAAVVWYMIATVGNAVAPWMIFFQGSGTIDKGVTSEELHLGRLDSALGTVLQAVVAAGAIIAGAALFGHIQNIGAAGPADLIRAFDDHIGRWPAVLFGIGLFNAGFLASITVSLSSSWSIAELFGWSKSLNDKISEAPKFYAVYIGSLVFAAFAILVPHLPLNYFSIVAQVIGGILMLPLLIFMVLMTNDQTLMGEYKTGTFGRIWGWSMVALLIALTLAGLVQMLFH